MDEEVPERAEHRSWQPLLSLSHVQFVDATQSENDAYALQGLRQVPSVYENEQSEGQDVAVWNVSAVHLERHVPAETTQLGLEVHVATE